MRKTLTLLLFLIGLIFVLNSNIFAQPPLIYDEEGIESVELNEGETVFSVCPYLKRRANWCHGDNYQIEVKTMIKNPEQKEFTYYYFVTGGKIIGQGANVIWDLKGEKIGEYSITVGIGNGEIIKEKIVTKKILLQYCDDCGMICSCPSLTVSGLSGIAQPGDILIFTANLSGGNQDRATFNWMVSAGTIIVGQGTSQILVKTSKDLAGQIVTATVEVGGLCSECPQTTQSATVKIK